MMNRRLHLLQNLLKENDLDSIIITNLYNLRYLAQFTGTSGAAVITGQKAYFITDARYTEQATKQCVGFEIVNQNGTLLHAIANLINELSLKTVGFESSNVTFNQYEQLRNALNHAIVLKSTNGIVESLRENKDNSEFDIIKQACAIADKAFIHILDFIKPGMKEIEVANELDFYMRSLGATSTSFDTIVASGFRSAMPHGVASDKIIEKGDFITLDYGCYFNGYVSDMTRTISLGEPSNPQLKEIYHTVLGAQNLVNETVKVGMSGFEVDKIARDYITKSGYGDYFIHSTGHGIGLEVHENPGISKVSQSILTVGHAITNEPGIYIAGVGGVRIEDDLLITENGIEIVTKSNKELIIL